MVFSTCFSSLKEVSSKEICNTNNHILNLRGLFVKNAYGQHSSKSGYKSFSRQNHIWKTTLCWVKASFMPEIVGLPHGPDKLYKRNWFLSSTAVLKFRCGAHEVERHSWKNSQKSRQNFSTADLRINYWEDCLIQQSNAPNTFAEIWEAPDKKEWRIKTRIDRYSRGSVTVL